MKWERDGEYAMKSGAYRITKNWTQTGWRYAAIHDKRVIGTAATADEAKAICEGAK